MLMKLIFLSGECERASGFSLCASRLFAVLGLSLAVVAGGAGWLGYFYGSGHAEADRIASTNDKVLDALAEERRLVADAKADQRAHLDALAIKLAELRAHVIRLNALGGRLVETGELDPEEFDFDTPPPLGGIEEVTDQHLSEEEIVAGIGRVSALLDDREDKLVELEERLLKRELMAAATPSGRPVKKGWMSSVYGRRTDPFTGKKSFHRGVDFAGKPGTEVIAVAAGVVTRSERESGYGNVVEIRHTRGYSTLYAHNKENKVEVGDMVEKGQIIALLGSTGRSWSACPLRGPSQR